MDTGMGFPEAGGVDSCELCVTGAGNRTRVLCKNRTYVNAEPSLQTFQVNI